MASSPTETKMAVAHERDDRRCAQGDNRQTGPLGPVGDHTGICIVGTGVTSLDTVEIIMTIEDKYDVTIPVDAVEAWNGYKTVANLIELGHSLGLDGHCSGS